MQMTCLFIFYRKAGFYSSVKEGSTSVVLFLIELHLEVLADSPADVRNNTERSQAPFPVSASGDTLQNPSTTSPLVQARQKHLPIPGSPAVLLPSHTLLSCSHPFVSPKEPLISPPVYNLVLSFQECYVRGIIQYVTFWDWFSFTQHNAIENHPKRVSIVGPFWLLSVVGVDHSLLSHPSKTSGLFLIFGQWEGSCYKYSRIVFCVTRSQHSSGTNYWECDYCAICKCMFSFLRHYHTLLQSSCTISFYIPSSNIWVTHFLHILPSICCCHSFIF